MPFGTKPTDSGAIDFDEIYRFLIRPAIESLPGLTPIRADEIVGPGLIVRDMIERLWESEIVLVDITALNANVFYELGVRHALRKSGTILVRKGGTHIPFDIAGIRVITYDLSLSAAEAGRKEIRAALAAALDARAPDSPVFDTLRGLTVTVSLPGGLT